MEIEKVFWDISRSIMKNEIHSIIFGLGGLNILLYSQMGN